MSCSARVQPAGLAWARGSSQAAPLPAHLHCGPAALPLPSLAGRGWGRPDWAGRRPPAQASSHGGGWPRRRPWGRGGEGGDREGGATFLRARGPPTSGHSCCSRQAGGLKSNQTSEEASPAGLLGGGRPGPRAAQQLGEPAGRGGPQQPSLHPPGWAWRGPLQAAPGRGGQESGPYPSPA